MKPTYPDENGYFDEFGGMYVGEILVTPLKELNASMRTAFADDSFWNEYRDLLRNYIGRETPCYYAKRLNKHFGDGEIWLKREDLTHTGAHKINNTVGQALLAKRMGKRRLIAETGAGQHGVATATVAALLGFECRVFMGVEDIRRQQPNVLRMELLGAEVVPVESGTGTLKDAMNETLRYWSEVVDDTFYVVGTVAGPHPEKIMQLMAWDVVEKKQFALGSGMPFTHRTILVTRDVAKDIARKYSSKNQLEKALVATARRPVYERAFANYWANPGSAFDPNKYTVEMHYRRILKNENGQLTDAPPWFPKIRGAEKIETVPVMKPDMTPILVTGDRNRNKVQTMPGGGYATIEIELPAKWNDLLAKLGYPPIEEFFLK